MRFSTLSMAANFAPEIDMIPGTEVMATDAHMYSSNRGIGASGPVPVPQPSNDPADPLNWRPWIKYVTVISQLIHVWVLVLPTWAASPLSLPLKQEFQLNQQQWTLLSGLGLITLVLANIILVPLSNIFGRRIVSIVCGVLAAAMCIWQGVAKNYMQLLISRLCYGLVAATSETIAIQVVTDISFLHQRSFWVGAYFFTLVFGSSVGSIIATSLAEQNVSRSFFWLCGGLIAFSTLAMIFTFPETRYLRNKHASIESSLHSRHISLDKAKTVDVAVSEGAISEAEDTQSWTGRGLPCRDQWWKLPAPASRRWRSFLWRDIWTLCQLLLNPIVIGAGLMVMAAMNLLSFFDLAGSGAPGQTTHSDMAFVIGGFFGLISAGPLSDTLARRSTLRNGGIREAEMRLPILLPYFLLSIASHLIGGLGFDRGWPNLAISIGGSGLAGLCAVSISAIATSYAVDSYRMMAGEVMTVASLCKNIYAFSLGYWVFDMATMSGWMSVFIVQLGLSVTAMVCTIFLYFWGKKVRRWTKDSICHRLDSFL